MTGFVAQSFWQLRIIAPGADIFGWGDTVEALARGAAPTISFVDLEDGTDRWACEALFICEADARCVLRELDVARHGEIGLSDSGMAQIAIEHLEPRDWVWHVQKQLAPVAVGPFVIHGRHDLAKVPARRTRLLIDAGQAFGTAHHATTTGCLEAIAGIAAHQHQAPRMHRVADIGTGTGILAIAAHRLLPRAQIIASDIDPVAVRVARANARNNQVAGRITFLVADGARADRLRRDGPYDLVIANILAGPLKQMASEIAGICQPGSCVILSGILEWQRRSVEARYRASGFAAQRVLRRGGWATLLMRCVR